MCLYLTRELQNKLSKYYLTPLIDILYKQHYCRHTIVNTGKVEIEILYSLDLIFSYLLPPPTYTAYENPCICIWFFSNKIFIIYYRQCTVTKIFVFCRLYFDVDIKTSLLLW